MVGGRAQPQRNRLRADLRGGIESCGPDEGGQSNAKGAALGVGCRRVRILDPDRAGGLPAAQVVKQRVEERQPASAAGQHDGEEECVETAEPEPGHD